MQKKSTNAQLIGQKLTKKAIQDLQCTTEELLDLLEGEHPTYIMYSAKEFILVRHLGYRSNLDAQRILSSFVDRISAYWSKRPRTIQFWDQEIACSLFIFLVLNDAQSLSHVCKWATPTRTPKISFRPKEIQQLYLFLCGYLRDQPASFNQLLKPALESKNKEVRAYGALASSIGSKDQEGFEKCILDCLQFFQRKPRPDSDNNCMQRWLPFDLNVFYLAGLNLGLGNPQFPSTIMAYLATTKSARLEDVAL